MKPIFPILLSVAVISLIGACERHSFEETRQLHKKHGEHADHADAGANADHAKSEDHGKKDAGESH